MAFGNVIDELHDDDRLADTGSAKCSNFASLCEGTNEVDDFDARLEDIGLGILLNERRSRAMNRILLGEFDRTALVSGLATSSPRWSPSVELIAIARTQFPPRCCWTSSVSLTGPLAAVKLISSASNILGSPPSCGLNSTSTTGPMTWTIFPLLLMIVTG